MLLRNKSGLGSIDNNGDHFIRGAIFGYTIDDTLGGVDKPLTRYNKFIDAHGETGLEISIVKEDDRHRLRLTIGERSYEAYYNGD